MKMLKTGLKFVFVASLIFGLYVLKAAAEEQISTAACVEGNSLREEPVSGVVVSPILTQKKDGKKWCAVYTATDTKTAWLNELKGAACSKILKVYSPERKKKLGDWLEGGENPWLSDT